MASRYRFPKRKPTNTNRNRGGGGSCNQRGRNLPQNCLYPTAPDGTINCNRYVLDPNTGNVIPNPDCDGRLYRTGSHKSGGWGPEVAAMVDQDKFSAIKLLFDTAKVRYGAALGMRRAYSPYLLHDDGTVITEGDLDPTNPNLGLLGLVPVFRPDVNFHFSINAKPDGRYPITDRPLGPSPVNAAADTNYQSAKGYGWSTFAKRYHYQSEALIKTTAMLLSGACTLIEIFFESIARMQAESLRENETAEQVVADILQAPMILTRDILDAFLQLADIRYNFFDSRVTFNQVLDQTSTTVSGKWEPIIQAYPEGKKKSPPLYSDRNAPGTISDYYNVWVDMAGLSANLKLPADVVGSMLLGLE